MAPDWLVAAAQAGLLVLLALPLVLFWRRPRLVIHATLRPGTRDGPMHVRVENAGHTTARRPTLRVSWRGPAGEREVDSLALDDLSPGEVVAASVRGLHAAIADAPDGWDALEARLVARNAFPATVRIAVQAPGARPPPPPAPPPVRYVDAAAAPCPDAQDGRHAFETRRVLNDGVRETWDLCVRCRLARRHPLTDEERATQARVRRERAERERERMEAEWARREAEQGAPRRPRAPPPPPQDDRFPPAIAFEVLGLDERTATWEDVQAAHRRLALRYHPDRQPPGDAAARARAEERIKDVNRARDRLREHFRERAGARGDGAP